MENFKNKASRNWYENLPLIDCMTNKINILADAAFVLGPILALVLTAQERMFRHNLGVKSH